MTGPSSSPLWRILCAPFTRRTWAGLAYWIASAVLDVLGDDVPAPPRLRPWVLVRRPVLPHLPGMVGARATRAGRRQPHRRVPARPDRRGHGARRCRRQTPTTGGSSPCSPTSDH